MTDFAAHQQVQGAAFWLLRKFHFETDCGEEDGPHCQECQDLVAAFGWDSWPQWAHAVISVGRVRPSGMIRDRRP